MAVDPLVVEAVELPTFQFDDGVELVLTAEEVALLPVDEHVFTRLLSPVMLRHIPW